MSTQNMFIIKQLEFTRHFKCAIKKKVGSKWKYERIQHSDENVLDLVQEKGSGKLILMWMYINKFMSYSVNSSDI